MSGRTRTAFYHTARWTKESKAFRETHPLCEECKKEGVIFPSQVVDHVIPLEICSDPWDHKNWRAICFRHNNKKAASDKKLIQEHRKINNPKM